MSKYIKKFITVLWTVLLVAMFIALIAFGITQLPPAQRMAGRRVGSWLSESLGVPVSVGLLRYVPFSTVEVVGIEVADSDSLPMLSLSRAKADISLISLIEGDLRLNIIDADSLRATIRQSSDGSLNIAALASTDTTAQPADGPNIFVGAMSARNCQLTYVPAKGDKIQFDNFSICVSRLIKTADGCEATLTDLSFDLPGYDARASIGGRLASHGDTTAIGSARLSVAGCSARVDTIFVISDSTGLRSAAIEIPSARATGALASRIAGKSVPTAGFALSAAMEGDVVKLRHARFSLGEASNMTVKGLIQLNRKKKNATLNRADIAIAGWVKPSDVAPLVSAETKSLDNFPALPFEGSISATSSEGEADIDVNSELGSVSFHAEATSADNWQVTDAKATIRTDLTPSAVTDGNVARLVAEMSGDARLNVKADKPLRYATFRGQIDRAEVEGHTIGGISFDGVTDPDGISGMVRVDDAIGRLVVIAEEQWCTVAPYLSVTAAADSVRLDELAPGVFATPHALSFKGGLETTGTSMRNASTDLIVTDFALESDTDAIYFDKLSASIRTNQQGERELKVESDIADAHATGIFDLAGLVKELRYQGHLVLPSLISPPKIPHNVRHREPLPQRADLDVKLKGGCPLIPKFLPDFSFADTLTMSGSVDSEGHIAWAKVGASQIRYGDIVADSLEASLAGSEGKVNVVAQTTRLKAPMIGALPRLMIDAEGESDHLTADIEWGDEADVRLWNKRGMTDETPAAEGKGGFISMDAQVEKEAEGETLWHVGIDKSRLPIGDGSWGLDSCRMTIKPGLVDVSNLRIFSGIHSVWAEGRASANPEDTLRLRLSNIVIEDVFPNDPKAKYSLEGELSLFAAINGALGDPGLMANAVISKFKVDGDNLEQLEVSTDYKPKSDTLAVDIDIVTGGKSRAHADAFFDFKNNYLEIPFRIDSLSAGFLNFYLDQCIDSWKGTTSGNLSIHGPLDDLKLDARLKMNDDNSFRVKQTDVTYYIDKNDSLVLSPRSMDFLDVRFRDRNGRQGIFGGNISHTMFSGLDMHLIFTVDDMLLLQTDAKESPSYYGDIYGSGVMRINGPTSNIKIFIDAQTGKKSTFTVAPNAKTDIISADFILFDSDEAAESNLAELLGTGTSATLKLHITPDAKLAVVIDPSTGNQLTGRGTGDLTIDVDRTGTLTMHGNYQIEQGIYNFTFSVFDKQFTIDNGSTIYWDGGPYDATVNIAATYTVKASIYSLISGTAYDNGADLKKRVPVKCKIFLTGQLTKPDVRFGIEIPSSQNFNQYAFDQYVNTQEELSRQVFSLLTAGQFYALQDANAQANQSQSYFGQTASELLSNKLSSLFSQNERNIGIGVNYRPGDEVQNEEYEVAISTQAFDNKVLLSGNIGYGRDASGTSSDDGTLIGDFDIEVKLNQQGNIRAKAYTHSNNDVIYETSPTTQGVGISFQEEFDSFRDLIRGYWRKLFHRRRDRKAAKAEAAEPEAEPATEVKTDDVPDGGTPKEPEGE